MYIIATLYQYIGYRTELCLGIKVKIDVIKMLDARTTTPHVEHLTLAKLAQGPTAENHL